MNFSQTCNLLSQFVKEKRSLGITTNLDASHGVSSEGNDRSTMNLFPVKQADDDSKLPVGLTINLFPQISGFNSSMNKRPSPEQSAKQMTIFYGGQVVVYDLPSDNAKEVMDLASNFEASLKKRKVETPPSPAPVVVSVPTPNPKPSINNTLNLNPSQPKSQCMPAVLPRAMVPNADLPIARKASLHRFLERRKDRLMSKASPATNVSDGGATKPVEGKAWLGLNSLPAFQQKQEQ